MDMLKNVKKIGIYICIYICKIGIYIGGGAPQRNLKTFFVGDNNTFAHLVRDKIKKWENVMERSKTLK